MLYYKEGSILESTDDIIIHGCNCFKRMGAGVAKAIRAAYPEAYQADLDYGDTGSKMKLGTYSCVFTKNKNTGKPLCIMNAYTQFTHVVEDKPFDYTAFTDVFDNIIEERKRRADNNDVESIGMPKIGSGLAGGDWSMIEGIIISTLQKHFGTLENSTPVTIYTLKK